ncbi:MAG TPA: hypothetical protein VGZ50_01490, partial [Actinomycetota bacterium]|nr:hypothetical protein [Actinomycetota bacterium]
QDPGRLPDLFSPLDLEPLFERALEAFDVVVGEDVLSAGQECADPRVGALLANREDVFPDYNVEGFERAFEQRFQIERREEIRESPRILYLMRGR